MNLTKLIILKNNMAKLIDEYIFYGKHNYEKINYD
jgi:hypothetical protein